MRNEHHEFFSQRGIPVALQVEVMFIASFDIQELALTYFFNVYSAGDSELETFPVARRYAWHKLVSWLRVCSSSPDVPLLLCVCVCVCVRVCQEVGRKEGQQVLEKP